MEGGWHYQPPAVAVGDDNHRVALAVVVGDDCHVAPVVVAEDDCHVAPVAVVGDDYHVALVVAVGDDCHVVPVVIQGGVPSDSCVLHREMGGHHLQYSGEVALQPSQVRGGGVCLSSLPEGVLG